MHLKRTVFIATAGILIFAAGWLVVCEFLERDGLRFIQTSSGVTFPTGISEVSVSDSLNGHITAHLTVPQDAIDGFVARNKFAIPQFATAPTHSIIGVDRLDRRFRHIPDSANFVLEGQSANHRWNFVLDRTSGDVWVTVLYPD